MMPFANAIVLTSIIGRLVLVQQPQTFGNIAGAMRKIVLKTTDGGDAGTITEGDDGKLSGDGRAAKLVQLASTRTFDKWVEDLHHSKYLTFEVQG